MAAGALCTGQGLRLLLALPAAVSAQGVRQGDWLQWWAAVVQWDAGVLVIAGLLTQPACLLGCAAVAYTASHTSEHLPLLTEPGTARPVALAIALGLLLVASSRRQARIPPQRSVSSQHHRLSSAPCPLLTVLHRTEPS
jgi:uncharacterized membrane protein YphA (DoxX/SURF4 family)